MLLSEGFEITAAFVNGAAKGEEVEFTGIEEILVYAGSESVTVAITDKSEIATESTFEAGDIYSIDPDNIASVIVK